MCASLFRAKATAGDSQEATQPWDGVPAPNSFDDDLEKELERLIFEEAGTHAMLQQNYLPEILNFVRLPTCLTFSTTQVGF